MQCQEGQQKVPILKKTTGLCSSRSYYSNNKFTSVNNSALLETLRSTVICGMCEYLNNYWTLRELNWCRDLLFFFFNSFIRARKGWLDLCRTLLIILAIPFSSDLDFALSQLTPFIELRPFKQCKSELIWINLDSYWESWRNIMLTRIGNTSKKSFEYRKNRK